jgi:hypothetical protein
MGFRNPNGGHNFSRITRHRETLLLLCQNNTYIGRRKKLDFLFAPADGGGLAKTRPYRDRVGMTGNSECLMTSISQTTSPSPSRLYGLNFFRFTPRHPP